MDASVVICAYTFDRWNELSEAVASVREQTLRPREIIVSIDGNEPLYRQALEAFDGVDVVLNNQTPGLSGARMTGVAHATAPIIAFLDDDAVADRNWLEELVRAYADDRVLGAGGFIEPMWTSPRPLWFPSEFNWVVGCTYDGMRVAGDTIRNVIGANMSVRADVLRRAGGFAGVLGRRTPNRRVRAVAESCEETEFCIRAARLHPGGRWVYRPSARVRHKVLGQRATWRYFVHRCRMEGAAKAVLTGLTGSRDGLEAERHYVAKVLSGAVLRELAGAVGGRRGSLARAGAIFAGLTVTSWAYTHTRLATAWDGLWSAPRGAAGSASPAGAAPVEGNFGPTIND